ncbi:MAG: MMPL family transporter, partial [Cellvibrionaceae bacterium]|nr:MMPL family transporter [Cellvibrionaceae bacterium]
MLATSRILFILGIMYSVAFFTLTLHDVHIDTRLDDLSPKTSQTANTRTAINALVEYSERKLIIGIVGNTVEQVDGASEQLRNKLTQTQGLSIHNITDKQQKIIDLIKPYRFHLLSQKQQNKLNTASDQALVLDAQKKLYQLGANLSLITFNEDPLGWFNEYLIKQLETLEQNTVNATTTPIAFELITVNLTADAMEVSTQKQLQQALTTLETDIARTFSVQFLHSGVFFFAADAATKSQQDIERISAGSIAATLLLLLFVFRSLSPLILPFLSIALGVSFAFAVSHTLYGSVHMLTIIFGASLIGIVIDYSLHFFCHQLAAHKNYENHKKLYRALLLSMLTSVIAYGALSFSGIEALKKVAVFSCAGLIMAWLCVVVIGPLLVFKKPALSKKNHYALFNQFANRVSLPKKIQLSIITGILLLPLLLLSLNKIHLSDDPRLFFQASANLLAQEQQLRNLSKSYEPGRYLLLNGKQSDDIYRNFEKVLAAYKTEKQQEIEFYTAMNFIPAAGQQQQNYQLQARLY